MIGHNQLITYSAMLNSNRKNTYKASAELIANSNNIKDAYNLLYL